MAIDPKDLAIHDDVLLEAEAEVDGGQLALSSFVTNVLTEELWLALRVPDPRLLGLVPEQPVHLTFVRGGALVVETEFLRRLGGARPGIEKSRLFAVRRPQGVDQVQRRAHVRVDLERQVRIRSSGVIGSGAVGSGWTVNIGAGGVQLITEMPLMFGDQVKVALVLTRLDIVVAGGPVVRIDEVPAPPQPGDGPPGPRTLTRVAIRFDRISEADQERITCHILAAHRRSVARGDSSARVVTAAAEIAAADAAVAELEQPEPADQPAQPEPAPPAEAEPPAEAGPPVQPTA